MARPKKYKEPGTLSVVIEKAVIEKVKILSKSWKCSQAEVITKLVNGAG